MAHRRSPILNWLAGVLLAPALGGCQPAAVSAAVRSVPVVAGLEHPWAVAWLPGGDLLITERPGRLRLVRGGVLQAEPIRGVPEVLAEGQGGLLDVAVHPRFATNRWIYLTYAAGSPSANHTRLARARFDGRALTATWRCCTRCARDQTDTSMCSPTVPVTASCSASNPSRKGQHLRKARPEGAREMGPGLPWPPGLIEKGRFD